MITLKQLKDKLEKDFGWENLESEETKWFVDELLKDTIQAVEVTDVSQQREQLIAFSECVVKDVTRKGHEEVVDYFLKKHKGINCG